MARLASIAKIGYFPTPAGKDNPADYGDHVSPDGDLSYLDAIANAIVWTGKPMPIVDFMCGGGYPITYLGKKWNLPAYGNEMDNQRFEHAGQYLPVERLTKGDAYKTQTITRGFAFMLNNPPYQAALDDDERLEVQALKLERYVAFGGMHLYIAYSHHFTQEVLLSLAETSSDVQFYAFPGLHLNEYRQLAAFCVVSGAALRPKQRAETYYEQVRHADQLPLVSALENGHWELNPNPTSKIFFFRQPYVPPSVGTHLCLHGGPHLNARTADRMAVITKEEPIQPIITPMRKKLENMVVAGLFNGIVLETERGLCAVRAASRKVEEETNYEEVESEKGEVTTKRTVVTRGKLTMTLLYEDGSVENLTETNLAGFVEQHIDALVQYAVSVFKPLYNFDFWGGTQEKKYEDSALLALILKRFKGKKKLPGQMHVIAAMVTTMLERGRLIVNAQPGFGKSLLASAALGVIYDISKIVWDGEVNRQNDSLKAFIKMYRKRLMKPGMFNLITAPSHLTTMDDEEEQSKWLREITSVLPEANARFVRNSDQLTLFLLGVRAEPYRLHVMTTSKEMMKDGEGFEAAYWLKNALFKDDQGKTQWKQMPHDPTGGMLAYTETKKGDITFLSEKDLNRGAWWYVNGKFSGNPAPPPRIKKALPNPVVIGNYDKGRRSVKIMPRGLFPLWQMRRSFSALKDDPRRKMAIVTGSLQKLQEQFDWRPIPMGLSSEAAERIKQFKVELLARHKVLPFPDLLTGFNKPIMGKQPGETREDFAVRVRAERGVAVMDVRDVKIKKNPRVPLAWLIAKRYSHMLYTYYSDELHENKAADTNAGLAFRQLASCSKIVVGLTGSLYGGVASSLRTILFMFNPRLRRAYPWGKGDSAWIEDMGVLERTIISKKGEVASSTRAGAKQSRQVITKELPGADPLLLEVLEDTGVITVTLDQLGRKMPPLDEIPLPIELDADVKEEYDFHANSTAAGSVWAYTKARLLNHDKTALSMYFHEMLAYPDVCYDPQEVVHNMRMGIEKDSPTFPIQVATLKGFGRSRIFAKEQAILDLLVEEKNAGRGVGLYINNTGDGYNLQSRYTELIQKELGYDVYALTRAVSTSKREKVLLGKKVHVLTTNPILVQTGLDLLDFPTLVFIQTPFNYYVMAQAGGRHWRANQDKACKTYYPYYNDTFQSKGVKLMAMKAAADAFLNGRANGSLAAFLTGGGSGKSLIEELMQTHGKEIEIDDATALFAKVNAETERDWDRGGLEFDEDFSIKPKPKFLKLPFTFAVEAVNPSEAPVVERIVNEEPEVVEALFNDTPKVVTVNPAKFVKLKFGE